MAQPSRLLLVAAFIVAMPLKGRAEENADRRIRYLASRLDARISELDKGDSQLTFLLDLLVQMADSPKNKKEDVVRLNFHIDPALFAKTNEANYFDLEKIQIKVRNKFVDAPLHSILEIVCTQMDAGYVVRNDCIEIMPISALRNELNFPNSPDSELRNLVVRFYDNVSVHSAFDDLAQKYNRNVILSPLVQKELEQKVTAHLLNVPFDTAVESLADMADVKILRRGNVTLVTNSTQATALKAEYEKRHTMAPDRSGLPKTLFPRP